MIMENTKIARHIYPYTTKNCPIVKQGRILGIRCASHASQRKRSGRTYGRTDGRTDQRTGGRTDQRTDGRTNGPTDPLIEMRGRILKTNYQCDERNKCASNKAVCAANKANTGHIMRLAHVCEKAFRTDLRTDGWTNPLIEI